MSLRVMSKEIEFTLGVDKSKQPTEKQNIKIS